MFPKRELGDKSICLDLSILFENQLSWIFVYFLPFSETSVFDKFNILKFGKFSGIFSANSSLMFVSAKFNAHKDS